LGNYLRKKEEDKDHMSLDRIENLFDGLADCKAHLCEQLFSAGKKMEAKGIFNRGKLTKEDVDKISRGKDVGTQLENMKYEKDKDFRPIKDMFEPISMPANEFLRFPLHVKIEFIDTEAKIKELDDLRGQRFIGVDAEWRPKVHEWQENKGPATLQIAGKDEAFIIDVIKLSKSKKLDQMLTKLFTQKTTIVVGFGFSADLAMFRKHCPSMRFIENIPQFVDAQDFYKAVYPDFKDNGGLSLAKVCERVMEKKLCKKEQISNWENRPLRYSQEHYGAMDAWVLNEIMIKLITKGKRVNIDKFIHPIGEKATKNVPARDESKDPKKAKKAEESKKSAEPKEPKQPREPREPKEDKPDPSKISKYESQIEYHTKKLEHFKDLLKRA
jgi:hypothetical protein